jgi:hypothetical protein
MSILMFYRGDCCGERFKNARIYVGNTPAKKGVMGNDADLCAKYAGPLATGGIAVIPCSKTFRGK